jgi:hypothetical protein
VATGTAPDRQLGLKMFSRQSAASLLFKIKTSLNAFAYHASDR